MKKIIVTVLILIACLTAKSSANSYASEIEGEDGEVVMVAIPNANGGLKYYKGNEAKLVYKKIMNQQL